MKNKYSTCKVYMYIPVPVNDSVWNESVDFLFDIDNDNILFTTAKVYNENTWENEKIKKFINKNMKSFKTLKTW